MHMHEVLCRRGRSAGVGEPCRDEGADARRRRQHAALLRHLHRLRRRLLRRLPRHPRHRLRLLILTHQVQHRVGQASHATRATDFVRFYVDVCRSAAVGDDQRAIMRPSAAEPAAAAEPAVAAAAEEVSLVSVVRVEREPVSKLTITHIR